MMIMKTKKSKKTKKLYSILKSPTDTQIIETMPEYKPYPNGSKLSGKRKIFF